MGRWLKEAREYADRHPVGLGKTAVWLFSSGPVGDPPKPEQEAADWGELNEKLGARGHRTFSGRIERSKLRFGDRAVVAALRAPEGDFRDFDEIRLWARSIAGALSGQVSLLRAPTR